MQILVLKLASWYCKYFITFVCLDEIVKENFIANILKSKVHKKKTTTDFDDVKTNGSKQIREKKSATNKAQLNLSPACWFIDNISNFNSTYYVAKIKTINH
jgi:hypothetical protein